MLIRKILIKYSDTNGPVSKSYLFNEKINLVFSNGNNTKGKTSLLRFIIWGLGFNISLTKNFKSAYSETEIIIEDSPVSKVNRKGYNVRIFYRDASEKTFSVFDDRLEIEKNIFGRVPQILRDQIIGYFYFDQDNGYRPWNRGEVIQKLDSKSNIYKIDIDALVAYFSGINYEKFLEKRKALKKAADETLNITKFISSAERTSIINTQDKKEQIKGISDQISQLKIELTRIKEKKDMYSESIKDYDAFNSLINKLSIKIKHRNEIIAITKKNVIQDNKLEIRLRGYKTYYKTLEKKVSRRIEELKKDRLNISLNNSGKKIELIKSNDTYKEMQEIMLSTGITSVDSEKVHKNVVKQRSDYQKEIKNKIKNSDASNNIWNLIVKMSNIVGLNRVFNNEDNRLLSNELKLSGAKRTLAVIIYRLGVLYFIENELNIKLPIILDSPASQEMDQENLDLLMVMLKRYFNNSQIIIATNQRINTEYIDKKIILDKGVLNTI